MSTELCCVARRATVVTVAVLMSTWPRPAAAQYAWDVAAFGGLVATDSPVPDNESSYEDWFHTGQYGISGGRHLTRHLKIELEAAGTSTGQQSIFRFGVLPGTVVRYSIYGTAMTKARDVGALATWQFLDNQWVHPFLSAGIIGHAQIRSSYIPQQVAYGGDPRIGAGQVVIPEQRGGPDTTVTWKPVIGGGAKAYFSPRAFFRADARATLGSPPQTVAFRAGLGIDF